MMAEFVVKIANSYKADRSGGSIFARNSDYQLSNTNLKLRVEGTNQPGRFCTPSKTDINGGFSYC